jgi:dephospho-CoA kinase
MLERIKPQIKGTDNRLLVGITGSIACGKTTVSRMLEELGSPVIDFDILARKVVAPGTPALKRIAEYFGKQVLTPDGNLDRKKMGGLVFQDAEKRKKLEGFIHPLIYEEFVRQVNHIAGLNPEAVIQGVVPLLIEQNLQTLFDQVVVVYISEAEQIRRLIRRDDISLEAALDRIKSQMPVAAKLNFADFVINNEQDPEITRTQVHELWRKLKSFQKERKGCDPGGSDISV